VSQPRETKKCQLVERKCVGQIPDEGGSREGVSKITSKRVRLNQSHMLNGKYISITNHGTTVTNMLGLQLIVEKASEYHYVKFFF